MKQVIGLCIFTLMISSDAQCQRVEDFIEMAKGYNPGLKSLKMEYSAALLKADQVKDWPDPNVSLGLGVLPVETRLGAQRIKIGVSQMIPWKGSLSAKSDAARAFAEVKSYTDEVKEIDIAFAIRTAYALLEFLESRKGIIRQRLMVIDALEELAKSSVRSGKGKLSNVLFTERQREMLVADSNLLNQKIEQPTILINRWAGRDLNTKVNIVINHRSLVDKEAVFRYAAEEHPQYLILDQKTNASNATIALTKFQTKPTIGVGLDYAYIDARNDVDIPNNGRDVLMPMGSISIPLHTGRFKAIRQEEAIKKEAIEAQRAELRDMYGAEIEMAYATIAYNDQIIAKYKSLKDITKETLKLMRVEYASEGTRFEELLRLEMELIDYDLEIVKAAYEKDLALATLYKFK